MPVKVASRHIVLVVLAGLFVLVLVYQLRGGAGAPTGGRATVRAVPAREAAARDRAESVPALKLAALKAAKAERVDTRRNLFREQPKAPPPPPPRPTPPPVPPPDPNAPPPPPPPPPPITLRLVGIVQGSGRPVAALADERDVFYGREGDVIEGRYRIVKINVESIDIAYLDGRGQKRLGLTK
jgi:hypothetical protein